MYGYFDHNATTPLEPRVLEAMRPWLEGRPANPSSAHRHGRAARRAVEEARHQVAELIGGRDEEIVFTASGTEANNAVILGTGLRHDYRGHLVISILEHPSVRAAARFLADRGMRVSEIEPGADGVVDPAAVAAALDDDTRLVCLMLANNEVGTLQPVAEVAARCRAAGVPVLCDAVQAAGKVPVAAGELGVDYLTLAGHKFYGPVGIAALWLRPGAPFEPLLLGGGQESGRRSSTESVPLIVGLGATARLARDELDDRRRKLLALQRRLEDGLARIDGATVHCADSPRLPHTTHVAFRGHQGHRLMLALDELGFAVSTGAACSVGRPQPSPTLLAMGLDPNEALASIRISLGPTNTAAEVDDLLAALRQVTTAVPA
ncbi:MAG: cysteine desulfurase [Acidobacteria bacterium]|nr:MAG: cysteine desulfurase [Acidobacteriota bacterium]